MNIKKQRVGDMVLKVTLGLILGLFVSNAAALQCRTCSGESCNSIDVPTIECNRMTPKLPFNYKSRDINLEDAEYICLDLEYIEEQQRIPVHQCYVTTMYENVCEDIKSQISEKMQLINCRTTGGDPRASSTTDPTFTSETTESSTNPTSDSTPPTNESTPPTSESTPESTSDPTPPTNESTPPTSESTPEPTSDPTPPTDESTPESTSEPTSAPTSEPTSEPTSKPTPAPTMKPTPEPTSDPTSEPTGSTGSSTDTEPPEQTSTTTEPSTTPDGASATAATIMLIAIAFVINVIV